MIYNILVLLIGWPGIITSLILSAGGIIKNKPAMLVMGAVFAVPISWYLNKSPRFEDYGIILPIFQLGAAMALHRRIVWLAWVLLLPFAAMTCWLAIVVLTQ